jgi:biopolymer transport protein ExbD
MHRPAATVKVSADGTCRIAEFTIPCAHIGSKLQALHVATGSAIDLVGDLTVTYKPVAAAMASLKAAGYRTKVAYITTSDGG